MHSKRFHLLYVFPEPLPLSRARGVQVAHFVNALAQQGAMVTLAYVPSGSEHPFAPLGIEVPNGVVLLPLSRQLPGLLGALSMKSHRLFMWRLARWIRNSVKTGTVPDMVFFRHVKAAAWCCDAFPRLSLAYEAHEVFAQTAKPSQRLRISSLERKVLNSALLVIANSQGSADGLSRTHAVRRSIVVLPNGVAYPGSLPQKDWADASRRIVYAGSLFGWKGVDDLVEAFNSLPGFRLSVIGGTPEQVQRLKERRNGGGGEIEFLGQQPHYEVQHRLATACIAVLPNRSDKDSEFTSPLKLFEYLASGCAVVATDLPAMREVLGANDAVWARPGDPDSLAGAIMLACRSPESLEQLGLRGRVLVRDKTWVRRADSFLAHAGELLGSESRLSSGEQ